jgi:hypothetical protein
MSPQDVITAIIGATAGSGIVSLVTRWGLSKTVDAIGRIPEQTWFDNVTERLSIMPDRHWFQYANQQLALIPDLPSRATLELMVTNFTLSVTEKDGLERRIEAIDALTTEFRIAMKKLRDDVDEIKKSWEIK